MTLWTSIVCLRRCVNVPRLPVDGKKVVEHRITLGAIERELLSDISLSYRIQSVDGWGEKYLKILEDPLRLIQIAYGIATLLDLVGIESGLPTPGDLPELYTWLKERDITGKRATDTGNPTILQTIQDFLTGSGPFEGTWPGGY